VNDTRYPGRCFCGSVKFTVTGPEKYACFCHCESCRRAAGGTSVPWATFAREGFVVTDGEMAAHHSTPGVTRGLCTVCGTSLTYENKLPWVVIDDGLPQYEKNAG